VALSGPARVIIAVCRMNLAASFNPHALKQERWRICWDFLRAWFRLGLCPVNAIQSIEVGSQCIVVNLPRSVTPHRGLENDSIVTVSAVGPCWFDVTGPDRRTTRVYGPCLRLLGEAPVLR
jgi:hypothetical protein